MRSRKVILLDLFKVTVLVLLGLILFRIVFHGGYADPILEPIWIFEVFILTILIALFLAYFYVVMIPKKDLEILFDKLNLLFKERDRIQAIYSHTHDEAVLRTVEAELKTDQRIFRETIVTEIKSKQYLKGFQMDAVRAQAEEEVKTAKSFHSEQELPRRLWLYGITAEEAKKIFKEVKEAYSTLVKNWVKEGISEEKIKEKLMKKEGFTEHRASVIMKYSESK